MLPGPTNVPERVTRAMVTPSINHRSDDFVELYEECVNNTKKIFETEGDAVCLSASGTGTTECAVVNLIKKDDKVIIPDFMTEIKSEDELLIFAKPEDAKKLPPEYKVESNKPTIPCM